MSVFFLLLVFCISQILLVVFQSYQNRLLDSVPIERGLLVSIISSLSPTSFHLCRFKIYNEEGQKMVRIERSFPKGE